LAVGPGAAGVLTTEDDRFVYVGIMGSDFVAVVDWRERKVVDRIRTGRGAHNVFPIPGDRRNVLVSNRLSSNISIVDTETRQVVRQIPVPGGPDCLVFNADGSQIWVTGRWSHKVYVVDMRTFQVLRSIPVGRSPHGIYLHVDPTS
jgi:YVTN family beta-propeller protein